MISLYYGSGSPYSWRVWLALEHKQAPYELKIVSFSTGDLKKPEFSTINPRRRVPVVVDDDFALYESAAIVEYLEERCPGPSLFPADMKRRATVRRLIREADEYLARSMEALVEEVLFKPREQWSEAAIGSARADFTAELARFEEYAPSRGFLGDAIAGTVDYTVYPLIALALRIERRKPELAIRAAIGARTSAWMQRVEALAYFAKTVPPHWKES